MAGFYSTEKIAEVLGVEAWRVRRLFESGVVPEPDRLGGRRVITPDLVPRIVDGLRDRGWLPAPAEATA